VDFICRWFLYARKYLFHAVSGAFSGYPCVDKTTILRLIDGVIISASSIFQDSRFLFGNGMQSPLGQYERGCAYKSQCLSDIKTGFLFEHNIRAIIIIHPEFFKQTRRFKRRRFCSFR